MKTFRDYEGMEGIDKLMEAAPYINEIIEDAQTIYKGDDDSRRTWLEIGCAAIKTHETACYKVMEILGHTPENAVGAAASMAKILFEIMLDEDINDFFTSSARMMEERQLTSATESTEGAQ